jgi:hypothetical protein
VLDELARIATIDKQSDELMDGLNGNTGIVS